MVWLKANKEEVIMLLKDILDKMSPFETIIVEFIEKDELVHIRETVSYFKYISEDNLGDYTVTFMTVSDNVIKFHLIKLLRKI